MQYIKPEDWNRQHIFESYLGTDFPYISVGCDLDITKLHAYTKAEGLSLYFSMVYLATKAANEIENFHYRFKGTQPYRIDENVAFVTHLPKGAELFQMVECDPYPDMLTFAQENRAKAELPLEKSGLSQLKGRDDILNFTCIPWVHYTHFIRTIAHNGIDCNPKISMGKYEERDGKLLLPFTSQSHHGMTDGYHVGQFFELLESYLQDEIWIN